MQRKAEAVLRTPTWLRLGVNGKGTTFRDLNKTGNADRTDNVDKIENANKVGNTDRAEKEKQKTESSDMVESSAKPNEQSATEQVGYKPIDVKL